MVRFSLPESDSPKLFSTGQFTVPDSPSLLREEGSSSEATETEGIPVPAKNRAFSVPEPSFSEGSESSLSFEPSKKHGSLQDDASQRPSPIDISASTARRKSRRPPSSRGALEDRGTPDPLWSPPMTQEGEQLDGMQNPEDETRSLHWNEAVGMLSAKILSEPHPLTWDGAQFLRYCLTHRHLVNLVFIRGFEGSEFEDDKPKRLLWEYCVKRNLTEVIRKRRHGVEEALVWHVLRSLLKAVMYLHQGVRERSDGYDTEDFQQPIIHNAINPDNVFFKGQDLNTKYPSSKPFGVYHGGYSVWPLVKLGNFSKARILQDQWYITTNADFPVIDSDDVTFFEPPEYTWGYRFRPDQGKGDIWSVAACAIAMTAGLAPDAIPTNSAWRKLPIMEGFYLSTQQRSQTRSWAGWKATELNHNYSKILRDFLESLLTINPTRRSDAITAYDECTERWTKWTQHLKENVDNPELLGVASSKIPIPPLTEAELPTPQEPPPPILYNSSDDIPHPEKQPKTSTTSHQRKRKAATNNNDHNEADKRNKRRRGEGHSPSNAIAISSNDSSSSLTSPTANTTPPQAGNPLLRQIRAERAKRIGLHNGRKGTTTPAKRDQRSDMLFGKGRTALFRAEREEKRRAEEEEMRLEGEKRRLEEEARRLWELRYVPDDLGTARALGGMRLEKLGEGRC